MLPTFLTNLATGALTILMAQIMSLTAWVNGSVILQGHLFWDNTNQTNSEYVGLQQTVKHTAAGYDFITNGSQSGAQIKADGYAEAQWYSQPCTATGGTNGVGGYYNTCNIKNPAGASGSLIWIRLSAITPQLSITSLSGGWLNANTANLSKTAGSLVFSLQPRDFNVNKTVGTGATLGTIIHIGSGGKIWGPQERFIIQTAKVIPKSGSTNLRVDFQFARHPAF